MRRFFRALLGLLVFLELIYVIAGNTFLNSRLFGYYVNRSVNTFIGFDSAWTPLPGLVFTRGFVLRSQDRNVQWMVSVDRARFVINILELPFKQLHIIDVKGRQSKFALRLRKPDKVPRKFEPEIPGFPEKPFYGPGKDPEKRMRFLIGHLALQSMEEIWIHNHIFKGVSELEGSFFLHPGKEAQIYDAQINLEKGNLLTNGIKSLSNVSGEIDGRVKDFFVKKDKNGYGFFKCLVGRMQLKGRFDDPYFLNWYVHNKALKISEFHGDLDANIAVDRGGIEDKSRALVKLESIKVLTGKFSFAADGLLKWLVKEQGHKSLTLSGDLKNFSAHHISLKNPILRGQKLKVSVGGLKNEIADLFEGNRKPILHVLADSLKIDDLAVANLFLSKGFGIKVESGRGFLNADLTADENGPVKPGFLTLSLSEISGLFENTKVEGSALALLRFQAGRRGELEVQGSKVELASSGSEYAPWQGTAEVLHGKWKRGRDDFFDGKVKFRLSSLKPVLDMYSIKKKVNPLLRNLLKLKDLDFESELSMVADTATFTNAVFKSDKVSFDGNFKFAPNNKEALLLVDTKLLDFGFEHESGHTKVKIFNSHKWYASRKSRFKK